MKTKQMTLYLFVLIFLIVVIFVMNDIDISDNDSTLTKKNEGFIGRIYRPINRRFRKSISSNVNEYIKGLYVSYKKFMY